MPLQNSTSINRLVDMRRRYTEKYSTKSKFLGSLSFAEIVGPYLPMLLSPIEFEELCEIEKDFKDQYDFVTWDRYAQMVAWLSYEGAQEKIAEELSKDSFSFIKSFLLTKNGDVAIAKLLLRSPAIMRKLISIDSSLFYELFETLVTTDVDDETKQTTNFIFENLTRDEIREAVKNPHLEKSYNEFINYRNDLKDKIVALLAYKETEFLPDGVKMMLLSPMLFPSHYYPELQKKVLTEATAEAMKLSSESFEERLARKRGEMLLQDKTYLDSEVKGLPPVLAEATNPTQVLPSALTFSADASDSINTSTERQSKQRRREHEDDEVDVTIERRIAP